MLPFDGDNAMQVVLRHLRDQPPSPRALNAALDPVFSRALAVDPRQRYRTVGELAAAFDQHSAEAASAKLAEAICLGAGRMAAGRTSCAVPGSVPAPLACTP